MHRCLLPLLVLTLLLGDLGTRPALAAEATHTAPFHEQLPLASVLPFVALLLSIALFPVVAPHWWERDRSKILVTTIFSLPLAIYLVVSFGGEGWHQIWDKVLEYASFIALIGSLFVISGGIYVQGSIAGTPLVNTLVLTFGGLIASFVGTTGASMLLIRPLLWANRSRQSASHVVVFFIFVVSNCGGLLTPLGDPPLFLGYLSGVPFEWTLRLWPQWLFVNVALLVVFFVWDQIVLGREGRARGQRSEVGGQQERIEHEPLRVHGLHNLALLAGVVATIYASGRGLGNGGEPWPFGVQEVLMLLLSGGSYFFTARKIHEQNHFSFAPLSEVAVLFAGIFITMTPALLLLNAAGPHLGIERPWQFFWATGILSGFLDNAPTYLTFSAIAAGMHGVPLEGQHLKHFLELPTASGAQELLAAISCGAVFMGANTYIGNGPNFMVKSIAEQNQVRMPGFFGYMLYSGCVLLPIFVIATWLFFV